MTYIMGILFFWLVIGCLLMPFIGKRLKTCADKQAREISWPGVMD